jgi:hypothetical protein
VHLTTAVIKAAKELSAFFCGASSAWTWASGMMSTEEMEETKEVRTARTRCKTAVLSSLCVLPFALSLRAEHALPFALQTPELSSKAAAKYGFCGANRQPAHHKFVVAGA